MTELQQKILTAISQDEDYLIALRHYFHAHPELPKEEFETQKKIEEELDKLGLEHRRIAGTGVYAEIKGELPGGKQIVLRADIDALPIVEESSAPYKSETEGKHHACGHDAHNTSLIGAARFLSTHRDLFGGTVRLTWQPGEEIGYGARIIVDEGDIDGCDRSFGIHVASNIPVGKIAVVPGPNNASVDWFRISIHGLGAHVSTPQLGVDAAYIASQIVVGIQSLVTRCSSPMENLLIGVGTIKAGTAYNVVAQEAELEGTIRAFSPELRQQTQERIVNLAQQTAAIYGGTAEVEYGDYTSPLINDATAATEAQKTAKGLFGEENVITSREPSLGGDDMAEYIIAVPGVYCYVGSGNESNPDTVVAHHNCHFDVDDGCLLVGASVYAAYAIEFLQGINAE